MPTRVLKPGPDDPRAATAAAAEGADALKKGQLVGFATETVYGIAAVASDAEAMERLRELKSRPQRPFSVHVVWPEDVRRFVGDVPPAARRVIHKAWPGPITLVLPTGGQLADAQLQSAGLHDVLTSEGRIGLRCPDAPIARMMLSGVDQVVVAPSANLAGQPSPRTGEDVLDALDGRIDLLIDTGATAYGVDSTIVACDGDDWEILRSGVHDADDLERMVATTYLFVCTGNTCRSPMGRGLAEKALADKLNCSVAELSDRGFRVESAGLFGGSGAKASAQAIVAAAEFGADISQHSSQKLISRLIRCADVVFCFTGMHLAEACRLAPSASGRIRLLDRSGDIPDPIGADVDVYLGIAERIDTSFRAYLQDVFGQCLQEE